MSIVTASDDLVVDLWLFDATMSGAEARARVGSELVGETSVSHSAGVTLLARAPVRVGVDVEVVREHPYLGRLARRSMTDTEWTAWCAAYDPVRAFTQHWTRVEAYLKAIGVGVKGGLRTRPDASWTLLDLDVTEEHVGALAIEARGRSMRVRWHAPPAAPGPTPMSRFRHGSLGVTLGAAMTGLANVLEPRKKEEQVVIVEHDEPDRSRDAIELHLDADNPSDSVVIIRPWADKHGRDDR